MMYANRLTITLVLLHSRGHKSIRVHQRHEGDIGIHRKNSTYRCLRRCMLVEEKERLTQAVLTIGKLHGMNSSVYSVRTH